MEKSIELTEKIKLIRTNWNDYGYLLTYEVYYQQNIVGEIKLISKNMFVDDLLYFENLNQNNYTQEIYFALPSDLSFYSKLFSEVKDDVKKYSCVLKKLRIITEINWENKSDFLDTFKLMEEKDLKFKTVSRNFIDVLCRNNDAVSLLLYTILKSIDEKFTSSIDLSKISAVELNTLLYSAAIESKHRWFYPSTLLNYFSQLYIENEKSLKVLELNSNNYTDLDSIVQKILKELKLDIDKFEKNSCSLGHYSNLSVLKFLLNNSTKENDTVNSFRSTDEEKLKDTSDTANSFRSTDEEKLKDLNDTVGCLRLTNAKQLNDPNEGISLLKYLFSTNDLYSTSVVKDNKKIIEKGNYLTSTYLFSMTAKYDDLTMWNMYGDAAEGVYLTFEINFLKKLLAQTQVSIYQVAYIDEKFFEEDSSDTEAIPALARELKKEVAKFDTKENLSEILLHLQPILYLFKANSYSFEDEYRIVYEHTNDSILTIYEQQNKENYLPFLYVYLTYVKTRYSEIMLGPKISESEYGYILPYILNNTDNDVDIVKSNIEFR